MRRVAGGRRHIHRKRSPHLLQDPLPNWKKWRCIPPAGQDSPSFCGEIQVDNNKSIVVAALFTSLQDLSLKRKKKKNHQLGKTHHHSAARCRWTYNKNIVIAALISFKVPNNKNTDTHH
jgi:hypothetical protein